MKISVPFFWQDTKYTCGPASLQMVLSFLGDFKSEFSLAKAVHVSKESGTKHSSMIEVACREGFFCYVNSQSTVNEIKHFLALGFPVILDYTEPSSDEGHYAVVVAIARGGFLMKEKVYLNDPWHGANYSLALDELLPRWHDPLTKSHGWMMVLSKEDFNIGKQYLPS